MAEKTDSSKRRKDILFIIIALAIIIIVAELFLFLPKIFRNI